MRLDNRFPFASGRLTLVAAIALILSFVTTSSRHGRGAELAPAAQDRPADLQPYVETIPGTSVSFRMAPVPGGRTMIGSPEDEKGREENEGPAIEVELGPFWMGACEVTWPEFDIFAFSYDIKRAPEAQAGSQPLQRTPNDLKADVVTRPTPPYVDMTFGYGHDGYPAICMTHHAATKYCEWLSAKTGRLYRLPSEAEWEHACRAGTETPWHFGSDPAPLGDHEWYFENSSDKPQPVGKKKPNPLGLYDMHGNVSEWVLDKYVDDYFTRLAKGKLQKNPVLSTKETVWHAVRGGSWRDDPEFTRSAVRYGADEEWSVQDPQVPKSIWWHTDAHFVGFRVVRPYEPKAKKE